MASAINQELNSSLLGCSAPSPIYMRQPLNEVKDGNIFNNPTSCYNRNQKHSQISNSAFNRGAKVFDLVCWRLHYGAFPSVLHGSLGQVHHQKFLDNAPSQPQQHPHRPIRSLALLDRSRSRSRKKSNGDGHGAGALRRGEGAGGGHTQGARRVPTLRRSRGGHRRGERAANPQPAAVRQGAATAGAGPPVGAGRGSGGSKSCLFLSTGEKDFSRFFNC